MMVPAKIQEAVISQKDEFLKRANETGLNYDIELGFALQQVSKSSYSQSIAMSNPESLKASFLNVAAIGITLNPAMQLAYLVPRDKAICLDISYMGFLNIAQKDGAILWGQAKIVRQEDEFELQGIDKPPIHNYNPFEERGNIVGVYCVVKTQHGDYLTHTMPISKVYDIRDRSTSYKAYEKDNKKSTPWVTDEEEMIKKTCVKQARKYWPQSGRLDQAIHYMNTDGGEGIQLIDQSEIETLTDDQIEKMEAVYILLSDDAKQRFLKWRGVDAVFEIKQKDFSESYKAIKQVYDRENP